MSTPSVHFLPAMGRRWLLPAYDPMTRLLGVPAVHRRLLDAADLQPGHRVLEIGCGTADLTLLAKARQPAATVVGLDPDPDALARAGRKARRRRLAVQLDAGSATTLPYPDASVDRVLSSLMLHHVPADEQLTALREVHRVLRPGGELHLVDVVDDAHRGRLGHLVAPHAVGRPGEAVAALITAAGFAAVGTTPSAARFGLTLSQHRAVR